MLYPSSELVIDPVLIRKYDVSEPRYTSYPTADRFVEAFGAAELERSLAQRNIGGISQPLSVCVQLPFSDTVRSYIKHLEKELALLRPLVGEERRIRQMHWGGTPTFLSREETGALSAALKSTFECAPDAECSIEVDPRGVEPGTMAFLAALGFNRVSIGARELDPGEEATRRVIDEARASGFSPVSLDVVYGLPGQSLDGFNRTLDQALALDPDQITLYGHAHAPGAEATLQIMTLAIGRLTRGGYLYIGMDQFARPGDELAIAQRQGRLQRSLQGYSASPESDLVALGVSAIGRVGPAYYQNHKRLEDYRAELDAGRLPVARGVDLGQDDLARRAVIQALACQFRVSIESIELAYLIDFKRYFAQELRDLRRLQDEGLVELRPDWIEVTPRGRLLVRALCMVFDRYLREREARAAYSKVI